MSEKNLILSYGDKKIKVKIPDNFEDLKDIFLKKFNEKKNKKFYFSYLSFIDKDIDLQKLKNVSNENKQPIINVFKEKEKEKEEKTIGIGEVIVGMSLEYLKKTKKKLRRKQKHLEEKEKNKLSEIKDNMKINKEKELLKGKTFDEKKKLLIEDKNESKRKDDEKIIKKLNSENNLGKLGLQPSKEIVNDAYNFDGVLNAFCVFKSLDDKLYMVYTTRFKSIISFNIIDDKKIKEIKNAHDDKITNFRYCFDKKNKIDLIISISSPINNIKLWKSTNLDLLYNFEKVNESGSLKSACFLNDNENIYIIVSNSNNFDKTKPLKIYDLNGNVIKEINNSKDDTYFIETYYDKKISKNFIITGNYYDVKSYDYNEDKLYYKYFDQYSKNHCCAIINDKEEDVVKLIESSKDGNVRIWDFHSGKLLNKIEVSNNRLFDLCLWDNQYLLVGCGEEIIKVVDLKIGKKIKTLHDFNSVISLKKIEHPKYGECLMSQGNEIEQIMLWIKST